jgi:hypothetical protein
MSEKRRAISQAEYHADFLDVGKKKSALEHALDIRKFEIDLYWKRATYFWAFIGATFAGYGAVQVTSTASKKDLSVVLSCLGVVFSFGWFCANKGSKQWQENWENHVDMLEDDIIGPLYKTVLGRPKPDGLEDCLRALVTGPGPLSVSKINQIISLFVTVLWCVLLYKSLAPFSMGAPFNREYALIVGATLVTCGLFVTWGRTSRGSYRHIAYKRETGIDPPTTLGKRDS